MLTTDALINSASGALESVFGVHVSSVETVQGTRPHWPEGVGVVSSIHFTGDAAGQMLMGLTAGDSLAVVQLALDRYAIELPVKEKVVHAELMNIFAANMTSALLREEAVRLSISTPDAEPAVDTSLDAPRAQTLKMRTGEGLTFVLCYYTASRKRLT